ncbi:MAG: hypothetical protein WC819_03490 [Parcubacteria group bacterium]
MNNKNIDYEELNNNYYDAMDLLDEGKRGAKKALKILQSALIADDDYVQTYIGLISVYGVLGDDKRREEVTRIAFRKTVKKFPKWPKSMEWGDMDNRAYMRAIQYMGDDYWDQGDNEKAIELYRLLLKMNPNDNQGVRYEIAALYAGLNGKDINKMMDEGNKKQNWNKLKKLVNEQNKKHKFWKDRKDA